MKEDVIRAHAELPALCEHIHLPLQSGSSAVLKRMRRTYDRGRYMDRVALIREHVPDCAITTDIIVGFPGETEADFEQTLEVVDEVGYDGAFTFVFSPRRETEAATMDDQVPHPVKVERMERLVELVQRRADRAGPALRRARDGGAGRRHRAAPTRPGCGGAPGTTRRSTSTGIADARRARRGRDRSGDLADAERGRGTALAQPRTPLGQCRNRGTVSLAIFGPTGVGKTGVAIALAELLRERGEDPVAISCDALQVYEGLETLTGAATAEEQARLEHRLVGFVPVTEPFSVGDYMRARARARSMRRWRPGGGRSWSAAPASTCGRRWPSSRWSRSPPEAEDSELWSPETRHPTTIFGLDMDRDAALRADRRPHRGDRRRRRRGGGAPRRGARARRAPPARRSASTSCSPATSSR